MAWVLRLLGGRPVPRSALGASPDHVGELYLADLSIPPVVYAELGVRPQHVLATAPAARVALGRYGRRSPQSTALA
jgi:hypothetical protein